MTSKQMRKAVVQQQKKELRPPCGFSHYRILHEDQYRIMSAVYN